MKKKNKNSPNMAVSADRRRMRLLETQRVVIQAEKLLCGPLITYWNSRNGEICDEDTEALRTLLSAMPFTKRLFLCLTSTGGNGLASLRIANLLRKHCESLVVLVPTCAASAATMIALAADEIWLAPHANLSPVDTKIHHALAPVNQTNDQVGVGQDELTRIIALWRKESKGSPSNPYAALWPYIHPLVVGAVDRANSLSLKLCDALMSFHISNAALRTKIATMLTREYPAHGYPIMLSEARRIGIPAKEMKPNIEKVLSDLQRYYVEAGKQNRIDTDQDHHHDYELTAIAERKGRMVFFRLDRDWYYRAEERRWLPMNASKDGWYAVELHKGMTIEKRLHIQ
ncbi:MAG TPA: hypothetical protein VKF42_12305 [Chitinivibrionales bacterium]|jgi:hypothetical protein|nr:hypothetical protein [Chitinivibrionales bacterium]